MLIRYAGGPYDGQVRHEDIPDELPVGVQNISLRHNVNGENYEHIYRILGRDVAGNRVIRACSPGPGVEKGWKYGYLPCGHKNNGAGEHMDADQEGDLFSGQQPSS